MMTPSDVWAKRFSIVALINGLLAIGWLAVPLVIDTRISKTIAGGSVGTWGYLGFLGLVLVGFAGFAAFAFFYYLIPKTSGGEVNNILAWLHLVLLEIGTIGITAIFGVAGYIGGIKIQDNIANNVTPNTTGVHQLIEWATDGILGGPSYLSPSAITLALAGLGALLGIIALFLAFRKKKA